jgi:hypothetical protein
MDLSLASTWLRRHYWSERLADEAVVTDGGYDVEWHVFRV